MADELYSATPYRHTDSAGGELSCTTVIKPTQQLPILTTAAEWQRGRSKGNPYMASLPCLVDEALERIRVNSVRIGVRLGVWLTSIPHAQKYIKLGSWPDEVLANLI